MVGGGQKQSNQPQQVNQTTTNIPEYAQPYFTDILQRAQAESNRPYQAYDGQRIAGFNANQTGVQNQVMGLQDPSQFGQASNFAMQAGVGGLQDPNGQHYHMAGQPDWDAPQRDTYMSPYMQGVVDITKREAITDAQKGQLAANLNAARLGSYGGARQLLATTERERNLGQNLSDIQTKGLQSAYENAQGQFNTDRQSRFNVNQQNLASDLSTQELGVNARQQGYNTALNAAQSLGQLGQAQQDATLARLQAQANVGQQQQQMSQSLFDQNYADFLRQRDYPMEQLGYFSNMLHGLPIGLNSTTTTYAPSPSTGSQLAGLGLGALSLYNLQK